MWFLWHRPWSHSWAPMLYFFNEFMHSFNSIPAIKPCFNLCCQQFFEGSMPIFLCLFLTKSGVARSFDCSLPWMTRQQLCMTPRTIQWQGNNQCHALWGSHCQSAAHSSTQFMVLQQAGQIATMVQSESMSSCPLQFWETHTHVIDKQKCSFAFPSLPSCSSCWDLSKKIVL